MPTGRDIKLDFLRVLAILSCITCHAMIAEPWTKAEYNLAMMFMPDTAALFIMASGALILRRESKCTWGYIGYRLTTFVPEFIIFSALYVILDFVFEFYTGEVSISQQLCYMFVTPTWGPGWFILALIGVYAVAPLLWAWTQTATRREVETGIVIWLLSTFLPAIIPHTPVDIPGSIFGTLYNYAGYMVIGYYLVEWPLRERSVEFKALFFGVCIAIGIVFGYILGQSGVKWGYSDGLTSGLNITVAMISIMLFGIVQLLPNKIFKGVFAKAVSSLSKVSLGIYCSHWLILRYWIIPDEINWVKGTCIVLLIAVPIAYVLKGIRNAVIVSFQKRDI